MTRGRNYKREYGDFQTPKELAWQVCDLLKKQRLLPSSVVEPTCGIGNFFVAALNTFPKCKMGRAFDIDNSYVTLLKKEVSKQENAASHKVEAADFFAKDWELELSNLPEPILIIGNPPWVTNSRLGRLQSNNLPGKYNFKRMRGYDALTGKSNFDISEWMIIQMIEWLQKKKGALAMLCKTSVARKVLLNTWKHNKGVANATMHLIDSKLHFNISADACLLTIYSSDRSEQECKVYSGLTSIEEMQTIGFRDGFLVADISSYERKKHLIDYERQYQWRTGIKHDCSKIMELKKIAKGVYVNGLGEENELEETCLFPLLKGSDLANGKIPDKYMLVPQTKIGQETKHLAKTAPKAWRYLLKYGTFLDKRASSIYKGKARFSLFGVGDYTFNEWKIAIPALYKKLEFAVIGPHQGKPIVFDDTVNFMALDNAEEAQELASLLNSKAASDFYHSFIFWDSKRPITVQLLKSLDIDHLLKELGVKNSYSVNKVDRQLQLTY